MREEEEQLTLHLTNGVLQTMIKEGEHNLMQNEVEKLREEIISEIQEIYKTNPAGGALHIVLDDGNTDSRSIRWCLANSIHEIEDMKVRELFVKCACDLLEIGDERTRDNVIWVAFDRMRGDNSEQG